MTFDPLRQRGQDRSPVWRDPAFALVTGRTHRNHEVLDQKGNVAFEAGPRRDLGFQHLLFNRDPRRDLAPAPPLLIFDRLARRRTFVHAARFDIGWTLQSFQPGDLRVLISKNLFQIDKFPKQLENKVPNLGRR